MKRGVVLAVVVAGAACALLLWWLRRDPAPPAAATVAAAAHAPGPDRTDRAARGSDAPDGDSPPLVEDDPHGTLGLEGQVVEGPDDHAVPGAAVTIDSHPPRTVTTDDSGNFTFDALVGRPYTLVAHAATGVAGPVTARLTAKSEPVILHLRTAATLAVSVTGPGGAAVGGATVELRGLDAQQAVAGGDGVAKFASVIPGGYQLVAWSDGLAHAYQRINITKGANQAKLALVRGAPVTGKVVDERGAPIANARVAYTSAGEFGGFGMRRRDSATSASDGTFKFDALPAGTFRFEGSHPSYATGLSPAVTVDGVHPHSDVIVTMSDGAIIRGVVVDGMHRPVVAARVRIGTAEDGPGRGGFGPMGAGAVGPPREGYTDADGTFEVHGLPKRGLVAVALHETGASHDKAIDASRGDVSGVELVLDVTGTIGGVVVDQDGQPIEGAQVSARPSFDGSGDGPGGPGGPGGFAAFRLRGMPQELTDGGGKFTLTGLTPGNYELSAARSRSGNRGRRGPEDAVVAKTGDANVKITLQPEGGVKGTVTIQGGAAPSVFTVQIGPVQQSFPGGGSFEIDDLPPGNYQVEVRGPEFQSSAVPAEVDPGKVADIGAITVLPGRTLSGIVLANNQPVANANVYGGHMLMATGTANAQTPVASMFNAAVKQTQSGSDGTFSLSGFDQGDLSIVAERTDLGRSPPQLVMDGGSNSGSLVLAIVPYGMLSGSVSQGGQPAEGIVVTCQSVSTPGVLYTAPSAADGTFSFDQLAADTYKVSATLRQGRRGMQFYSQQVTVASGGAATVNLTADGGSVTLTITVVATTGTLGGGLGWLASQPVTATNARDLTMAMAALGQSMSAMGFMRGGQPIEYENISPGTYTECVVALPNGLRGQGTMQYVQRYAAQIPSVCQPIIVAATPTAQSATVQVVVPPMIGTGSGAN